MILNQFRSLVNGDQFTAGTNHDDRNIFWENFRSSYPETVTLNIDGALITVKANHSVSGKTTSYWATIDAGVYKWLTGGSFGLSKKKQPSISIQFGTITIYGGGKFYTKISNGRVFMQVWASWLVSPALADSSIEIKR